MYQSLFLKEIASSIHSSWSDFLTVSIDKMLVNISESLNECDYTPTAERVLRFLTLDVDLMNVVVIGQDPYPQKGVATGRAFEVAGLNNWNQPFRNVSLKNIVRSVYYAYHSEYLTYKQIISKMGDGLFPEGYRIAPPDKFFELWEKQGVLLLNTSFTCEIGCPGSHSVLWREFTMQLLEFINNRNKYITWFLWGKHAQDITNALCLNNKIKSNHPMICKPGDDDFLFGKSNAFLQTKDKINWNGV